MQMTAVRTYNEESLLALHYSVHIDAREVNLLKAPRIQDRVPDLRLQGCHELLNNSVSYVRCCGKA